MSGRCIRGPCSLRTHSWEILEALQAVVLPRLPLGSSTGVLLVTNSSPPGASHLPLCALGLGRRGRILNPRRGSSLGAVGHLLSGSCNADAVPFRAAVGPRSGCLMAGRSALSPQGLPLPPATWWRTGCTFKGRCEQIRPWAVTLSLSAVPWDTAQSQL